MFSPPDGWLFSIIKALIVAALCVQNNAVVRRQNASLVSFYPARRNCRPLVGFLCFRFVCMYRFFFLFVCLYVFFNWCTSTKYIVVVLFVLVVRRKSSGEFTGKRGEGYEVWTVSDTTPPKRNNEGEEQSCSSPHSFPSPRSRRVVMAFRCLTPSQRSAARREWKVEKNLTSGHWRLETLPEVHLCCLSWSELKCSFCSLGLMTWTVRSRKKNSLK